MAGNSYQTLIEQIIQKQASVLGLPVAVRRARNVPGVEVDDTGAVTAVPANASSALESLVEQYKALSGAMGVELCKQATSSFRASHSDISVPAILS